MAYDFKSPTKHQTHRLESPLAGVTLFTNITIILIIFIGACAPVMPLSTPYPTEIAVTTTPTALPSLPVTGQVCNAYKVIEDTNNPDSIQVSAGSEFIKKWKLQNQGTCAWTQDYKPAYSGYATKMGGEPQTFTGITEPGQMVEVSVRFIAPSEPGVYVSSWFMTDSHGISFFGVDGKPFYVRVVVY